MQSKRTIQFLLLATALFAAISCDSQQQKYPSPPGYDFNNPVIYKMPDPLREISGITFINGRADTIYAEQDEEGKVFHFRPGDSKFAVTRFWKKGDFEDIAISSGFVVMLRSDGTLFTFPVAETGNADAVQVKSFDNLLPSGEYEGLAAAPDGKIYVLCKHCRNEKTSRSAYGYIFQLNAAGNLILRGNFEMDVRDVENLTNMRKINFHPSALALNPKTGEWFVLSATNKLVVITDAHWKVKSAFPLNPVLFQQPEGIAFDAAMNLYISNERSQAPAATILAFNYKHK